MKNGLRTFDSDMHVYDPADLYVKYMNPKWGERIPRGQRNGRHGRVDFQFDKEPSSFVDRIVCWRNPAGRLDIIFAFGQQIAPL